MKDAVGNRTLGATVIALLALAQAAFGVLRALGWFHIGSDLMGQGLLLLPMIGMVAYARGALIAGIALLYILFALAVLTRQGWARPIGIVAAIVNLLLALSVVVQGESLLPAVLGSIVPAVILWHLYTSAGAVAARPAISKFGTAGECSAQREAHGCWSRT